MSVSDVDLVKFHDNANSFLLVHYILCTPQLHFSFRITTTLKIHNTACPFLPNSF